MATEKIGPLSNRVFSNLLDQSFKNGSISAKEYRDLRKKYFGKPKLIQMDLFPNDPKKKQKGGLMEQTNGLKKMGLKKGGRIRGPQDLKDKKNQEKMSKLKKKLLQKRFDSDLDKFKKQKKFKELTPQQKKELLDKIKRDKGQMTNPFLKFNKLGQPFMEAKGGGLAEATAKLKAQGLKKGGFPDLSGDGKVTMKDILMGRGVIKKKKGGFSGRAGVAFSADNKLRRALKKIDEADAKFKRKKPKKKQKGGAVSAFEKARQRKPSGRLTVDDIKRATPRPSMTLKGGGLRGVKDAPEEFIREKKRKIGKALTSARSLMKGLSKAATGPVAAIGKAGKKAGRLAKRGYGLARK